MVLVAVVVVMVHNIISLVVLKGSDIVNFTITTTVTTVAITRNAKPRPGWVAPVVEVHDGRSFGPGGLGCTEGGHDVEVVWNGF